MEFGVELKTIRGTTFQDCGGLTNWHWPSGKGGEGAGQGGEVAASPQGCQDKPWVGVFRGQVSIKIEGHFLTLMVVLEISG